MSEKPLGRKAYGSIPHLIGSNRGPADKGVNEGQHRICTEKCRKGDTIVIQEKLDGSCCSVAKHDGQLIALQRSGFMARTSPYPLHHLFADWVDANHKKFDALLANGERVVGEWLALAHGTRYAITHSPFVAFDIMKGTRRETSFDASQRILNAGLVFPKTWQHSNSVSIQEAMEMIDDMRSVPSPDQPEGVIYRVENKGQVDFLAKFVRNDFVPGRYLPEMSGGEPLWNWHPNDH